MTTTVTTTEMIATGKTATTWVVAAAAGAVAGIATETMTTIPDGVPATRDPEAGAMMMTTTDVRQTR